MKNQLFLMLTVLCVIGLNAQTKKITGTVTDETSLPLPGVNIVIKGTKVGTQTDFDGNYEILATKGDILIFSYLGYITEEVTLKNSKIINVSIKITAKP